MTVWFWIRAQRTGRRREREGRGGGGKIEREMLIGKIGQRGKNKSGISKGREVDQEKQGG